MSNVIQFPRRPAAHTGPATEPVLVASRRVPRGGRGYAIPAPPAELLLSDRAIRKARAGADYVRSLMLPCE